MKIGNSIVLLLWIGFVHCIDIRLRGNTTHPLTVDGWPLTVEYFAPAAGQPPRKFPVLICHGVLSNRNYFKAGEERSLVSLLSAAGYAVYLTDLRGREDAGGTHWFFGDHTYSYSMDDHIEKDADTLLDEILRLSGASQVNWLGHSMGGMIAFARLGTFAEKRIANLVTIASPGNIVPINYRMLYAWRVRGAMDIIPALAVTPFARTQSYTHLPFIMPYLDDMLYYPENLEAETLHKLLRFSTNDESRPLIRQIIQGIERGEFVSANGEVSYSQNLVNISIPALLLAARRDNLVDPASVRYAYERISSKDKSYLVMGRDSGQATDYGHTDIVIGRDAHKETIPLILRWLNQHN